MQLEESVAVEPDQSSIGRLLSASVRPIDNASVTFFRLAFGAMMAAWAWDYLVSGRLTTLYVNPQFHFGYYGFGWVQAWPGNGMYFHFAVLIAAAVAVAAGFYYRFAALVLALGFTYFFLIERTNYQNHYYLLCLFCWLMVFLPLNRRVSLDAARGRVKQQVDCPAWVLWSLQFHVAVPYFFGGIAKLTPDWLLGQPLGIMLSRLGDFPVFGGWLAWPATGIIFSYFALVLDLAMVPALLSKRWRKLAFAFALLFHLGNSVFFSIHVFPWFMIVATTLFFDPDWPARLLGAAKTSNAGKQDQNDVHYLWKWSTQRIVVVGLVGAYVSFHCLWPLRHNLYAGQTSWNERGHLFAWRMMLRGKEVGVGYALRDPASGNVTNVDFKQFIASEQAEKFPRDPEMILHMAHYIADRFESEMGRRPEVYAIALASLNGRKPQMMVDVNVDLASQPRGIFFSRDWVPPLEEPLRVPPWDVPVEQWREHVELPEIKFIESNTPKGKT